MSEENWYYHEDNWVFLDSWEIPSDSGELIAVWDNPTRSRLIDGNIQLNHFKNPIRLHEEINPSPFELCHYKLILPLPFTNNDGVNQINVLFPDNRDFLKLMPIISGLVMLGQFRVISVDPKDPASSIGSWLTVHNNVIKSSSSASPSPITIRDKYW